MRSLDEHLELVLALVEPIPSESVSLAQALGRAAAIDHYALTATPPFDNSAMDGYAVHAEDLATAARERPVTLPVDQEALAGHPATRSLAPATVARIMTGALIPDGADAVVPQELVDRDGDHAVFRSAPTVGAHIRRTGEDARVGDVVITAGTVLTSRHLAAAAASGLASLEVRRRPRVGYLVTGDELRAPGEDLGPGQIHDSNGTYLAAALTALGAEPVALPRVGDEPEDVLAALAAADHVDLVVTTGGASVGDKDPVKAALSERGVDFTKVAMQPGKPQGVGRVDGVPVLCLPGNPVAVAVSTELFVGAAVRRMLGLTEPAWQPKRAGAAWRCPAGREQVMPVVCEGDAVRPATDGGSGSHLVARLAQAEALALVPADADEVPEGDVVMVRRYTA